MSWQQAGIPPDAIEQAMDRCDLLDGALYACALSFQKSYPLNMLRLIIIAPPRTLPSKTGGL
jgi:hypothetical protein